MTLELLEECSLCGGTSGRMLDGAHALCRARCRAGLPTPSLGDLCPVCQGAGVVLDFYGHRISGIRAQYPVCRECGGSGKVVRG